MKAGFEGNKGCCIQLLSSDNILYNNLKIGRHIECYSPTHEEAILIIVRKDKLKINKSKRLL